MRCWTFLALVLTFTAAADPAPDVLKVIAGKRVGVVKISTAADGSLRYALTGELYTEATVVLRTERLKGQFWGSELSVRLCTSSYDAVLEAERKVIDVVNEMEADSKLFITVWRRTVTGRVKDDKHVLDVNLYKLKPWTEAEEKAQADLYEVLKAVLLTLTDDEAEEP